MSKKRDKITKLYDKYSKKPEQKFQKPLVKFFKSQSKRISKAIKAKYPDKKDNPKITKEEAEKQAKKILETSYSFNTDIKELTKLLKPLLHQSANVGNDLANIRLYSKADDYIDFSIVEQEYLKFLDEYGVNLAKNLTETTINNTRRVLRDGIIKGESYSTMAKNIVEYTDIHSVERAKLIAETEVHTTFMVTRDINATNAGFKEKHWMDSDDSVVRPWHRAYDNKGWVAMDYLWGGVMRFPGDPSGSARENARCRCEIQYR